MQSVLVQEIVAAAIPLVAVEPKHPVANGEHPQRDIDVEYGRQLRWQLRDRSVVQNVTEPDQVRPRILDG